MKKKYTWLLVALVLLLLAGNYFRSKNNSIQDPSNEPVTVIEDPVATDPVENPGGESDDGNGEIDIASLSEEAKNQILAKDGSYTSKDDVALYLYLYGDLPQNFITKKEAQKLGWSGGGLDDYAYGKCIGGDYYGNYEGLLPEKKGRSYHECDIDTLHKKSRGAKRIVYSTDGLIYYTDDHYESFELLYGEE